MEDETNLYAILESKGYDQDSAKKVVDDVLDARKIAREQAMKKYVGKRVKADFEGLLFEVIVNDVKINHEGKLEWQVKPLNGSKSAWVRKVIS